MRGEDHVEGDAVSRYGSLATLVFNGPHLYATLVGGGWVDRLAEAYPAAPALLFHAYVALVTSNSIALLAPTLYQRRLIDAKGMSAMQFLSESSQVLVCKWWCCVIYVARSYNDGKATTSSIRSLVFSPLTGV